MKNKKRGMTPRTLRALAILVLGLGAALVGLAGVSSAIEEVGELPPPVVSDAADCEPFAGAKAFYSDWADEGAPVKTEENSAPGSDTATERWLPLGETEPEVIEPAEAALWANFSPNKEPGQPYAGPPSYPSDPEGTWQHENGKTIPPGHVGPDGVYQLGQGNGSWFYRSGATAAVTDTDFTWQKQVRTLTPAVAPTQCVAGTDSDGRTLSDGDCETGTVTETFQYRLEQTPGTQDWGPWQTSDVTTRDMTPAELATCDTGGDPGDPGNPGGGEVAGNAEVLGIEANAPAAAGAPAAAPTAVDAGFGAEQGEDSSLLWLLVGGAMVIAGVSIGLVPARVRGKRSW